jgi:hypothetical protein
MSDQPVSSNDKKHIPVTVPVEPDRLWLKCVVDQGPANDSDGLEILATSKLDWWAVASSYLRLSVAAEVGLTRKHSAGEAPALSSYTYL